MALGRNKLALLCVVLLVLLIAVQGIAAATAPKTPTGSATRIIGSAGFAYVAGLRTFGAAVIWNRLEPQFHDYYEGTPSTSRCISCPRCEL